MNAKKVRSQFWQLLYALEEYSVAFASRTYTGMVLHLLQYFGSLYVVCSPFDFLCLGVRNEEKVAEYSGSCYKWLRELLIACLCVKQFNLR